VGCKFPADAAVYPDQHARLNPDASVPELNTPCGIYEAKCGTENWLCSYGHDEYLFQVLQGNKDVHSFPSDLWNIIRFHSL
jgi:inositol oxygenase